MVRGLAELIERELLPVSNLLVLLLPIVLLGIEFAAHSAIAVTLPDPSPDVAKLDTPPVRRPSVTGSEQPDPEDQDEARSHAEVESEPSARALPPTGPSVFSDSPIGYGG